MKVLYVDALSTPTAKLNVLGMKKAYEKVATVEMFDYRAGIPRRRGRTQAIRAMSDCLLRKAISFKPDLVHLGKCEILLGSTVLKIKRQTGAFIVHVFGDWRRELLPFVINIGKQVDVSLFSNANPAIASRYRKRGCRRIEFWCAGTDPAVYHPFKHTKRFDIVFMANMGRETKNRVAVQGPRGKLLRHLVAKGLTVHLFGRNTGVQAAWHPHIYAHPYAAGAKFAQVCSMAKIGLGYGVSDVKMYTSWPRLVNTMASGCFYLTNYFPGLETLFKNKVHLVWFKTFNEAVGLAKYYLSHDAERKKIAQAGRREILAHHTWDARIAQVLKWAGLK